MSRLIDADELKRAFIGNRYGTKAIEYIIDNAATVKAVPVEFIKEQIAKTTDINNLEELDVIYAGNLSYFLKLWERENADL